MGKCRLPDKVQLFAGLLYSDDSVCRHAVKSLERVFGRTDFTSEEMPFNHTDYYHDEFGPTLIRKFVSFKRLFNLDNLFRAKLRTNTIETRMAKTGKRRINIDPGYLNLSKVVLFTTKDFSHRLYLGNGIYAESTLFYREGMYNPWPWTYPDYKSLDYARLFESIRQLYRIKVVSPGSV